jgi:ABC-2 type transport system ATP-binding protein
MEHVSFSVAPGSVTALVGPNGAGKTTLLRLLAALDAPYAGRVVVDGLDAAAHPRLVHQRLGYLPDFFGLYDELTVRQSLIYAALARKVGRDKAEAAAAQTAARVGLADRLSERGSELSRGLRQRLAIAQTIVHAPRVLLLDEPAAGLDPEARRSLSNLILDLQRDGMTIIVSSHILAELEDYCSAMLVMSQGRLIGGGAISTQTGGRQRVRLRAAGSGLAEALTARGLTPALCVGGDGALLVEIPDGPEARAALLRDLVTAGVAVSDFAEAPRTLEEAYLSEVGAGERR